jgi:phage terminase small subunit
MAEGLTEKQELYCRLVVTHSDADAYRMAYNPTPGYNINADIWRLNKHPLISQRIRELQVAAVKASPVVADLAWLLRWWFDRMVYDPRELTQWGKGSCRYCHGDGHGYHWRAHEFMEAMAQAETIKSPLPDIAGGFGYKAVKPPHADCPNCDGKGIGREDFTDTSELSPQARAAFEGVKRTKDGIEIKMADKAVAAQNFAKLAGLDVQQVRLIAADVPTDDELASIAHDPVALAERYKRVMASAGNGATKH